MYAGTIGILDSPASEPIESWSRGGGTPCLEVEDTQDTLAGPPVQTGLVASRINQPFTQIDVSGGHIQIDRLSGPEKVATSWVAEVVNAGIVIASSVYNDDQEFPFPFDVFTHVTNTRVNRANIRTEKLGEAWQQEDVLQDTWMVAESDNDESTQMVYGEKANRQYPETASIGLGFERSWEGTVARGVVYNSGYVSCFRNWPAEEFVSFVVDTILPYAYIPDDDDKQSTLGDSS